MIDGAHTFLFRPVDATPVGFMLFVIAAGVGIWGFVSIIAGYDCCAGRDLPRWHWRRFIPMCFEFWLGVFLLLSDAGVYAILGFWMLRRTKAIPFWEAMYVTPCFLSMLFAFYYFGRDRIPDKGGDDD